MAEGQSNIFWKDQVAGIAECPICTDSISNNRMLPCGHTFCLKCLEKYKHSTKSKGKPLPCPTCRKEFTIPKGGCSALPKNFIADKLMELNYDNNRDEAIDTHYCDTCDKDSPVVATVHCIQCDQNLCDDCQKLHSKLKVSVGHLVVPVSKSSQYKDVVPRTQCEHHPGYSLELVCIDCKTSICWKCRSLMHSAHSIDELENLVEGCCEQLQCNIEDIMERLSILRKISVQIKDQEERCQDSYEKDRSQVQKMSSELIRIIVSNEETLQNQLYSKWQMNLKSLETHKSQIGAQVDKFKRLVSNMEQLKDCGNGWEIYRWTTEYHSQSLELLRTNIMNLEAPTKSTLAEQDIHLKLTGGPNAFRSDRTSHSVSASRSSSDSSFSLPQSNDNLTSSSLDPERQHPPNLSLSTSRESFRSDRCSALSTSTETLQEQYIAITSASLLTNFPLGSAVLGVSAFKQRLFIAVENSIDIAVYNSSNHTCVKKIPVPGLKQFSDLVFCPSTEFLYVADWETRAIFKVAAEGTPHVKQWSTGVDYGGISITTKERNVLFSCHETNSLKEFNSKGELIRHLKIESDSKEAICPWHALKLTADQYLVSHGDGSESALHRVCLININGGILKTFGSLRGRGPDKLFGPYHLALDSYGNIMVVDCNNSRIVVLDKDLKFKTEFSTKLRKPRRICFDSTNKRLYVTDNTLKERKASDGRLVTYAVNYGPSEIEKNYN